MTPSGLSAQLRGRWNTLNPRERTLIAGAVLVLAVAVLWWVGLAPALKTLAQSDDRQRNLDAQFQQMQVLAAEAQALQSRPKARYDDVLRALETSVKQGLGGGAQLVVSGERATITLKNVPASALSAWLAQARVNARAVPTEARLVRSTASTPATGTLWDGTLVLTLPPR
jgi:general secretion pathway protein M